MVLPVVEGNFHRTIKSTWAPIWLVWWSGKSDLEDLLIQDEKGDSGNMGTTWEKWKKGPCYFSHTKATPSSSHASHSSTLVLIWSVCSPTVNCHKGTKKRDNKKGLQKWCFFAVLFVWNLQKVCCFVLWLIHSVQSWLCAIDRKRGHVVCGECWLRVVLIVIMKSTIQKCCCILHFQ